LTHMAALFMPRSACMFLIFPNTVLDSYMQIEKSWKKWAQFQQRV
jgi:hypothetical protein